MDLNAVLTKRESEMTGLTVLGHTKKEIANNLFVSVRTVENTMRNVFKKADVNNSTSLSLWWFCKYFGISPDEVKSVVSGFMLVLVVINIFFTDNDTIRVRRCRTRARKSETELIWEEWL